MIQSSRLNWWEVFLLKKTFKKELDILTYGSHKGHKRVTQVRKKKRSIVQNVTAMNSKNHYITHFCEMSF